MRKADLARRKRNTSTRQDGKGGPIGVVWFLLTGLGFVLGVLLIRLGSGRLAGLPQLTIWSAIIGLQTGLWVAMAPSIYSTLMEFKNGLLPELEWRPFVSLYVLFSIVVGGGVFITPRIVLPSSAIGVPLPYMDLRMALLFLGGFSVAAPAVIGIWLILYELRRIGHKNNVQSYHRSSEKVINRILYLRMLLQRFFVALGAMVGLATLATGALRNLDQVATSIVFPREYVLLYGGLLATVLALIYIPTYAGLQSTGRALRDALLPVPTDPKELPKWHTDRQSIEQLLRLSVSVGDGLQAAFGIFAPVVASIITLMLSGGT